MAKYLTILILPLLLIGGAYLTKQNPAADNSTKTLEPTNQEITAVVKKIIPELPSLCLNWQKFPDSSAWKKYEGQFFSISFPASFTVMPDTSSVEDSSQAVFISEDKNTTFGVSAPQWDDPSSTLVPDARTLIWSKQTEKTLTCETELGANTKQATTLYLKNISGGYLLDIRFHLIEGDSKNYRGFTFTFTDQNNFLAHKKNFLDFLHSLEQYAN